MMVVDNGVFIRQCQGYGIVVEKAVVFMHNKLLLPDQL